MWKVRSSEAQENPVQATDVHQSCKESSESFYLITTHRVCGGELSRSHPMEELQQPQTTKKPPFQTALTPSIPSLTGWIQAHPQKPPSIALRHSLQHQDSSRTYAMLLFLDYSFVFNTSQTSSLVNCQTWSPDSKLQLDPGSLLKGYSRDCWLLRKTGLGCWPLSQAYRGLIESILTAHITVCSANTTYWGSPSLYFYI